MNNRLLTIFLILVSFESSAITIKGSINNNDIGDYTITIDGDVKSFNSKSFTLTLADSRIYQLKIESEGFYPSIQTFSHNELSASEDLSVTIAPLSLVKKKPKRVMLAFGGDVMMGRRYAAPHLNEKVLIRKGHEKEDTKRIVAHVKPYMEIADYSAVNLETQISKTTPKQRAPKGVTFFSPPETLGALKWAGIDYVTLGNNHVYDYLDEGLVSTLKYLKEYELDYSGAGLDQKEALKAHQSTLNGQDFSMLGFVGWEGGFSPNQVAEASKGGSAFGSKENIITTVARESGQNRATIVQYHGSLEYTNEPTAMTESRLKTAIDKGADLVIAHHPHVTQGFELYEGKFIAYSMGNFIFDQYFHDTPHSFVLYVWMDGEEFHRAEIVPIYIKGYMPIPATGIERNIITRRVNHLSGLRGLESTVSGGHIMLSANKAQESKSKTIKINKGNDLVSLYSYPVLGNIQAINNNNNDKIHNRYRLGRNLLNGGDFENYDGFTSEERGWELENATLTNDNSINGSYSIKANTSQGTSKVGMKTFRRVFKAGNPMSYRADIKTNEDIRVKLYFQRRKTRDKLKQGFANDPVLLEETVLKANSNVQTMDFDFNTPRVGLRSYRVWLEISNEGASTKPEVYLDDVALIEWQAHYNEFGTLPINKEVLGFSTHLGLELKASKDLEVEIVHD